MATSTKLQSRTPEQYGDKYQDHLLEQYKLFVETSQKITEKRQTANNYLLTLCSSLVTLFVTFLSTFGHHRWNVLIPIAGLFVCFIWWSLVNSYKNLNTAKFKVIHEIEEQLPVALFDYEWHVCGKGKDRTKYVPLTHLERLVPWMFGLLFVALGLYAVLAPVDKKPELAPTMHVMQAAPNNANIIVAFNGIPVNLCKNKTPEEKWQIARVLKLRGPRERDFEVLWVTLLG